MQDPSRITRLTREARPLEDGVLTDLYAPPATPWLRANFVSSLDGAAEIDGSSSGLSSPPDQRVMRVLRMWCDALLLGAGTFRVEGYAPPLLNQLRRQWRSARGMPEHPTLVLVSGSLDLDPAAPALAAAPTRPIVLTSASAPAPARARLAATADVITAGQETVDLPQALTMLHERGLRQILSEGGPHLLGGLAAAGLVDELCLTLSPQLTGGGADRIGAGPPAGPHRMSLHQVLTANDAIFLRYQRTPASAPGDAG